MKGRVICWIKGHDWPKDFIDLKRFDGQIIDTNDKIRFCKRCALMQLVLGDGSKFQWRPGKSTEPYARVKREMRGR